MEKLKKITKLKRILRTSDSIFVLLIASGLALEYFYPWSVREYMPLYFQLMVGLFVFLLGSVFIIEAKLEFNRHEQSTSAYERKTKLITTGVFRYSRNPLYLGLIIAFLGLGITTGMMWWIVLDAFAGLLFNIILIRREEKYLTSIFGDEYLDYRSRVRRWITIKFNFKKI